MFSNKEDLKKALVKAMIEGDDEAVQEILNEGAAIFGQECLLKVLEEAEEEANAHSESAQTSSSAAEAMIAGDKSDDESYESDESEELQKILEEVAGELGQNDLLSALEEAAKEANTHSEAAQTSSSAAEAEEMFSNREDLKKALLGAMIAGDKSDESDELQKILGKVAGEDSDADSDSGF